MSKTGADDGEGAAAPDRNAWNAATARAPLLPVVMGGRCPRCGRGALFAGYLAIAESCAQCGLDFSAVDTGDGPAVFVILLVGFLIVPAALIVEFAYAPPYWLHALLWFPLTLLLPVLFLRPLKALLAALQYRTKAAEGRLDL